MPIPSEIPRWSSGDPLLAADLNKLAGLIPRIDAGRGIEISEREGRLVVSTTTSQPMPKQTFWARITGHEDAGPNRWTYTVTEAIKTAPGYGGWADKPNGRTGDAYNLVEDMNDGSGVEGDGIDINGPDFPAGFSLRPAPDGLPVLITVVTMADQTAKEWWFAWENPVDGTCAAQP